MRFKTRATTGVTRLCALLPKRLLNRLPLLYYPYDKFMHRYQCVFVHIPKNAGSSVLKAFDSNSVRWHAKAIEYKRASTYFYHRYYKFAVVREPLARLYSSYCYAKNGGNQQVDDLAFQQHLLDNSTDFSSFIQQVLSYDVLFQQTIFQPQYWYIFDKQHCCQMDKLLRYETLAEDWHTLAKKRKFPTNLPWVNASANKPKSLPSINEAAKQKVYELYYYDFKLLGYPIPSVK